MFDGVDPPEIEVIPPGEGCVRVTACPNPFEIRRVNIEVEAGRTVAEIIAIVQPEPALRRFAHVVIGDHEIARGCYHLVRPKPGAHVLIRMLPTGGVLKSIGGGGGDGGKNPLAVLVSIVSVIAAIAVPALIPGIASIGIAGGMTVGTLISGSILVAGGIISNQLAAPAKPKLAALSAPSTSSPDRASPTLSITGARNAVRPNSPIASILGTHWQVPALAAPTYTEFIGPDQYLTMCVVWGIGPLDVSARKIGDTPIEAFQNVEIEFKRGYQPSQINYRGGWSAATGLFPVNPQFGDMWRVTETGVVQGVTFNIYDTITYNGLGRTNNPWNWDVNEDQLFKRFPFDIVEESEQITLSTAFQMRTTALNTDAVTLDFVFYRGLAHFNDQGQPTPFTVEIHVQYALTGVGGAVQTDPLIVTSSQVNAVRVSHRFNFPERGQYDIYFRRTTDPSTDTRIVDDVAMTSMKSIRYEPPFDHRGGAASNPAALCCEVIRIKATDQLQGVIDDLSGVCRTICPVWDGISWYHHVTDNPAFLFRHIYQNAANAVPLRDDEINIEDIQYWAIFCNNNAYVFNHVVDYPSTVEQIAADIAAAARASVTRRDNKVTVVIDEPATVPVQAFTPRNSWDFRSEIQYPELPHGFRVKFVDNLTGKGLERLVFDDGYNESNAYLFEALELTGVTDPTHAYRMGRYHIATARLRRQSVSFRADMERVVCTRGDLIRFSHDVPLWGLTSGRVIETFVEGAAVIGVRLDELVTIEEGKNYTIRFRRAGSAMLESTATVTQRIGESDTISFSPIAGTAVGKGDIFWFGETGREHRDLRVHAIVDPQSDMSARLICIENNNVIYTAEYGPIPPYDPGISTGASILYPHIISIRSDGTVVFRNPTGNYDNRILIIYSRPSGTMAAQIEGVEALYKQQWMENWQGTPVSRLALGEISLTEVNGRTTYDIYLRFVRKDGSRGMWSPLVTHTVIADDGVPPDVVFFVVTRMSDGTRRFEWRMVLEPEEVVSGGGYRIKYQLGANFDWNTATNISTAGLIPASPWESNDLSAGVYTFGIKAVTASGVESMDARTLTVELGDPRMRNVLVQSHEHLEGWPGAKTDCFVWGSAPRHLHAGPAEGSRWEVQDAWSTMAGVKWSDLPRVSPISYTTLVFSPANGRNLSFTPRVEVDGDDVTAVEMRAGVTATGGNLDGYSWGPLAQVVQMAYVQFRVTATGPKIRQMIVTVDGEIVVDDIEDVNTLTTNETWFQRLGTGWFRVAVRSSIAAITGAAIRAIQSNGTNWTWQLVSKNAQVGANPNPAAEFRVYNGGVLTDALVDIELKGPLL